MFQQSSHDNSTHPQLEEPLDTLDIINVRHIFHCQKNTARLRQALGDIFHYLLPKRPRKHPLKAERRAAFKVRRSKV